MHRGDSLPLARARGSATGAALPPCAAIEAPPREAEELPAERPIVIEINGYPVGRLLATPDDLEELAAGWVFAHGFAVSRDEVRAVTARGERVSVMIDAPGPGGRLWESLLAAGFDARHTRTRAALVNDLEPLAGPDAPLTAQFERAELLRVVRILFEQFRRERGGGGYHFAGGATIADVGRVMRDISRHNALDKLIGSSILSQRIPMPTIVALSGRVSADIVFKAWRAGIPIVVTRSLPTAEAAAIAEHAGVTVAGRALHQQPTIYSHGWRLSGRAPM